MVVEFVHSYPVFLRLYITTGIIIVCQLIDPVPQGMEPL